ncbi:TetR/AcrR family transcriptional regulator [Prolixibacteraceae bacterium JC049]|nr:TetR/AcrR family transcriptional regulator [Prolixibacteraceae bacterium JC049]
MMNKKTRNTEAVILEAAKHVFQRKGMDGARMQEIADEAGINKAMLHYYYKSKQQLFMAVFKSTFALLAPQLFEILNDNGSLEEKIRQLVERHISFMMVQPDLPCFIFQEVNRTPEFVAHVKNELSKVNMEKFNCQVQKDVEQKKILPIKGEQLFINILALNLFPFLVTPVLNEIINKSNEEFNEMLEDRKTEVADFIIRAIKV